MSTATGRVGAVLAVWFMGKQAIERIGDAGQENTLSTTMLDHLQDADLTSAWV
jgi:hypothetical protein